MDFNFLETYQNLPDEELIRIVAHAGQYQPAAVATARTLLAQRGITNQAIIEYQDKVSAAAVQKERKRNRWVADDSIQSAAELLDPNLRPNDFTVSIPLWIKLLLLAVLLLSTWLVYTDIRSFYLYFRFSDTSSPDVQFIVWTSLDIATLIAGLSLLWKGNKWGWILMAYILIVGVAIRFISIVGFFYSQSFPRALWIWMAWLLLYSVLLYGWFRERFIMMFKISKKDKIIALFLAFLFLLSQFLLYLPYFLE